MATLLNHRLMLETSGSFSCHDISADLQALVETSGWAMACWWRPGSTPPRHSEPEQLEQIVYGRDQVPLNVNLFQASQQNAA